MGEPRTSSDARLTSAAGAGGSATDGDDDEQQRRQSEILPRARLEQAAREGHDVDRLRALSPRETASAHAAANAPRRRNTVHLADPTANQHPGGALFRLCCGAPPSATAGLDIAQLKRRRHWRTVFDVFDGDGEGSIDIDEIKSMLTKFTHACNVDAVLEALDTDGSGDIGFEEFFAFGLKSEAQTHGEAEHELINKRIFDLIDEDHGGSISIDELHEVFVRLGQNVSMDDVYNIVSDIDEDGDGTLDAEEFSILLHRLHI